MRRWGAPEPRIAPAGARPRDRERRTGRAQKVQAASGFGRNTRRRSGTVSDAGIDLRPRRAPCTTPGPRSAPGPGLSSAAPRARFRSRGPFTDPVEGPRRLHRPGPSPDRGPDPVLRRRGDPVSWRERGNLELRGPRATPVGADVPPFVRGPNGATPGGAQAPAPARLARRAMTGPAAAVFRPPPCRRQTCRSVRDDRHPRPTNRLALARGVLKVPVRSAPKHEPTPNPLHSWWSRGDSNP